MGFFDIFKRKPKITPDQEMMAMTIAMIKHSKGEQVKGLKIVTAPDDPRRTNITLDPAAALELLGPQLTSTEPEPVPETPEPLAVKTEEFCVFAGIVDEDGSIEEIPIGWWDQYEDYEDALYYAEQQAEADELVENRHMADTWTKNPDDTELGGSDYVIIARREV